MATATLSNFQKDKINHVFTLLYDRNGDDAITKKDFDVYLEETCTLLGWTEGSEKHNNAQKTLTGIWQDLKTYADENEDGKVSQNEWLSMWTDCIKDIKDKKEFPAWQKNFIEFMFTVNDTSGDGQIDIDEYTTVYKKYKVSEKECRDAFGKIAGDVKNTINKAAFEQLWYDYFLQDDEQSNANYLFGSTPFLQHK